MKLDNRTLGLIVIVGILLVLAINPGSLLTTLSLIQTVVFIILGIVATLYLWKRL